MKRAVVTGARRGIGASIADALAADGLEVSPLDLEGGEGIINCDVVDSEAVEAIARDLGPVDVLVNNAGIWRFSALEEVSDRDFADVIDVNLRGAFHCTRSFGKRMLDRGGVIINVASIAAEAAGARSGAYSASKAALVALTKQTAVAWGPRGVRCNAVAPGFIHTPGTAEIYGDERRSADRASAVPLRRIGTPRDVAAVVAFLSSAAAGYVTGQTITVDGGFTEALLELIPRPDSD